MSTRAHIRIKEGSEQIHLYHHCDGYPDGVGSDLRNFLSEKFNGYWDACEIANALVKGVTRRYGGQALLNKVKTGTDDGYEITTCIHGDEEYVYVIDCDKKTLKCYSHGWDQSFEDTCKPENECVIP